ncbi:immunity 53 family protein [Streptomyces sp. BE147]|uniref:immunity 53 family protein n=1 Tax=Streptomyces sp. BE147 TaxID=3002524 RepID=UPI002E7959AD|nr:immunity 53 family protein [Streptomyces sp. BE147]MEE1735195.1 immunity 53 family protein [Streptomyces sp. BE147]
MSDSEPLLDWLQNWYTQQCDGDWEHEWGVKIATLDNPGWTIEIDLEETDLEGRDYNLQEVNRGTQDWVRTWIAEKTFHAACGPENLTEALTLFRTWATTTAS